MGNFISQDDNEITVIKKLYRLSKPELDVLQSHIIKETYSNIEKVFIHSLRNKNNTLKNKIPHSTFSLVDTFLAEIEAPEQTYTREDMRTVFKLSNHKYTIDELKTSYKQLAMRYHPDRPNGNNDKFQLITKFYMALMEDLKLKEDDKQFTELKTSSQDFIAKQNSDNKKNLKLNHFEPKLFNNIFEETKIEDEDDGYKEWMENTKNPAKDIVKNTKLSGNFNSTSFNTTFEEETEHPTDIVEYKIPEGVFSSSSIQPQELGSVKKNYTTEQFSDFKEAHTTSRIGGRNTRESFKNIDELKHTRENIVKLSEKELEQFTNYEMSKQKQDEERQLNLKQKDERHFSNYNRIHDRMIQSSFLR